MSKKRRRNDNVLQTLNAYSDSRTIDVIQFSELHCRMTDDFTSIDFWPTTGRYWIMKTNYFEQGGKGVNERGSEKGELPHGKDSIFQFLDELFFAIELNEQ